LRTCSAGRADPARGLLLEDEEIVKSQLEAHRPHEAGIGDVQVAGAVASFTCGRPRTEGSDATLSPVFRSSLTLHTVSERPTRLVLIRHGESRAAIDQVVGGVRGCTGLSEVGIEQCRRLRDRLALTGELGPVDGLLASVLPRAIETAELIAPALAFAPADITKDCDLCELHPGECDGMTWDEFRQAYGDPDMANNPYTPLSPGGESLAEFHLRVGRTLTRLAAYYEGRTAVIASHGGVIYGSLVAFLGLPRFGRLAELNPDNASITEWSRPAGGRWRLVRYNDTAHLADPRLRSTLS
jgi:probable phosphoglycerate mutase